ncbi:hypothetical protein J1N35_046001 [Gossypium stocksii]|uniref:Uncharacterized protein n=1 Tax=Gossypium stocksii TaxID=47602 RepID=A0A9D3UCK0_9ROSI|nr:hypothetical protein J1N35_046001 [Gossypium stocksii]
MGGGMGATEEPVNFFYCFCNMKLCSFLSLSIRKEKVVGIVNLLTASTNHRVVGDTGINHKSRDSWSETDGISRKINEAMDIDSLISGSNKKCKTTVGVVCINFANEEQHSKGKPIAIDENTPSHVPRAYHSVPVVGEALIRSNGGSSTWCSDLSMQEYPHNPNDVASGGKRLCQKLRG